MKDMLRALEHRFGEPLPQASIDDDTMSLRRLAARGSCRSFTGEPVNPELVRTLCALALCAPSKSDLQQRDIIVVEDAETRAKLNALIEGQDWVADAPAFLVFCGNNRRQRQLHDWRGKAFANDHLDAFFNAAVDAGIALSAFVIAAESAGLGCCPVSAIRNHPEKVAALLGLPDHVFAVAGLALGWPEKTPEISPRLPLSATVHLDRYGEAGLRETVNAYDRRRAKLQPYGKQRFVEDYGPSDSYGWSEDKARQYAKPERANFGAYVRRIGFRTT